ncbi:hypothetical protein BKN51_14710 [Amycolatopsis sp. BJA-103]|nr:hypothetical protein BKN51_14710 [Amycolatopsis sp. BJA-103]
MPDDTVVGDQPLRRGDTHVPAGGQEVRAVGGRDPRADAGDADVVDGGHALSFRHVEIAEDDDSAFGFRRRFAYLEFTADEDIDAVVPARVVLVVHRRVLAGAGCTDARSQTAR